MNMVSSSDKIIQEEKKETEPTVLDETADETIPTMEAEGGKQHDKPESGKDDDDVVEIEIEPEAEFVSESGTDPESEPAEGEPAQKPSVNEDPPAEAETETEAEEEASIETEASPEARLQGELAELNDKYVRLMAEFENYKRRTAQDLQTRFKYANQELALSIISGLDNLERAIAQAKEEEENEQLKEFVTGVEMVIQQFFEAFSKNGIERIFPKGEPFDPNQHEAMGVIETDEIEPDHVAEVFQAGYVLHDRVIRPAMVQVAKKK